MKSIYKSVWERIHKQPYGTDSLIDIKNIKVSKDFLRTTPHVDKIKKHYEFYNKHHYLDSPITIHKTEGVNILQNGYIRYMIAINEIDEYCKLHNIDTYESVPEYLKKVPVKYN